MQSITQRSAGAIVPGCTGRQRLSVAPLRPAYSVQQTRRATVVRATEEPEDPKADKKMPTRQEEPEEYWKSKAEQKGNVMLDPMAIVGVTGIFFPFILLAIAAATGVIDISAYRGN